LPYLAFQPGNMHLPVWICASVMRASLKLAHVHHESGAYIPMIRPPRSCLTISSGGELIAEHAVVPRAFTAICLSSSSTDAVFHTHVCSSFPLGAFKVHLNSLFKSDVNIAIPALATIRNGRRDNRVNTKTFYAGRHTRDQINPAKTGEAVLTTSRLHSVLTMHLIMSLTTDSSETSPGWRARAALFLRSS
jgi:hypothetical protein